MTIHRSHRQKKSEAVVTTSLKRQLSRKVFPVHRLDHRTSGALVFAFNSDAAALLQTALSEARKTYVALLRGDWEEMYPGQTSITVGIPLSVHGIAKDATSIFTRLAVGCAAGIDDPKGAGRQATRKCTLVSVQPVTGRTHQIRRHARHLGMTVLGDTQHGDSVVNRWWRTCRDPPLGRLALHCLALDFVLPARQEKIAIVAPLPRELLCVFQSDDVRDMWNEAVAQEPRLAAKWIDIRGGTLGIRKDWQIEIDKKMKNRAHERKTAP
jgi:tRNA pseudouridine65 synthase